MSALGGLPYAYEIAHYDEQLGPRMDLLQERGMLDNTLIIAPSDNGPPFPRMKGHPFEQACHLPLAVMGPRDLVAPGRSFADLLANRKSSVDRATLLMGRERNDVRARPGTVSGLGCPVRALRSGNLLYLHNFESDRWPGGNPELGLKDTDNGPTKKAVEAGGPASANWLFCFGKRPAEELYDLGTDRDCVNNLAAMPASQVKVDALRAELLRQLKQQGDPRLLGPTEVFDNYRSAKQEPGTATAKGRPAGRKRR